jgi:hypothetical protein
MAPETGVAQAPVQHRRSVVGAVYLFSVACGLQPLVRVGAICGE